MLIVEECCQHPMQRMDSWRTHEGETKIFCPEIRQGLEVSGCIGCEYGRKQPGPLTARLEKARRNRAQ
jgi:hypothetical protein